jgi:FNIP Repeat
VKILDASSIECSAKHAATFKDHINTPNLTLTRLWLPTSYNSTLHKLSHSLVFLSLGEMFNRGIDNLPESLMQLEIRSDIISKFNQPLTKLPQSLTSLNFLGSFKMDKEINLPPSVTSLRFGDNNPHRNRCNIGSRDIQLSLKQTARKEGEGERRERREEERGEREVRERRERREKRGERREERGERSY